MEYALHTHRASTYWLLYALSVKEVHYGIGRQYITALIDLIENMANTIYERGNYAVQDEEGGTSRT